MATAKGIDLSLAEGPSVYRSAVPPSARYSTLQDLDSGRHTEIDMFSGALVRMGRELGIPMPYNEFAYHMIRRWRRKMTGCLTTRAWRMREPVQGDMLRRLY